MKNLQNRHETHMLTHALNSEGACVNVNNVPNGNRCGCICPACKEPLTAKNRGNKRIHHFAHQSGADCPHAYETMLHLLAKQKIQEKFLNSDEFWITLVYKSFCHKTKSCKYKRYSECCKQYMKRNNLKEYYDSCEQETSYDNIKRRSDLKIFSFIHPERRPIYIEICVTHASVEQKLHSGNRIIEIFIEDEKDIENIINNGFVEEMKNNSYPDEQESKVNFYGFNTTDYKNSTMSNSINIVRALQYSIGKIFCQGDTCNCKEINKSSRKCLIELIFHTNSLYQVYNYAIYKLFQETGIKNCVLCKNYVDNYNGSGKICRYYKHLQIPKDENHDTSRAKSCQCFEIDKQDMERVLKRGLRCKFEILQSTNKLAYITQQ